MLPGNLVYLTKRGAANMQCLPSSIGMVTKAGSIEIINGVNHYFIFLFDIGYERALFADEFEIIAK